MEIKYLEWNLHAMGGCSADKNFIYKVPDFIAGYLKLVDIFVLVEFRQADKDNWQKFKDDLNDFDLYCSPYVPKGYNQVCIGIRKSLSYELLSVVSCDFRDKCEPEFLKVGIKLDGKEISIIGTRIKTGSERKPQVEYLKNHLQKIDQFICLGDYNAVYTTLAGEFSMVGDVYGPRTTTNCYYSYVHENDNNDNKVGLDWLISKGIENVHNGYSDNKQSPYATYDWSFVTESNGYENKTEKDYLDFDGLPDHAILKGMIEV